jgi:hypothetical protein
VRRGSCPAPVTAGSLVTTQSGLSQPVAMVVIDRRTVRWTARPVIDGLSTAHTLLQVGTRARNRVSLGIVGPDQLTQL